MPVLINIPSHDHHLFRRAGNDHAGVLSKPSASANCINIGLINNMPDSALVSTERQLFDLLSAAVGELSVRLHFYTMETTRRAGWGCDYVRRFYLGTNDLWGACLDGVIVTGAEPGAASLKQEPFWRSFEQVIEWAGENTVSAVCSCLAVHGAVLHLDGVERHPLSDKCIGVFAQRKAMDHPLMQGIPSSLKVPHSRWNEVREQSLAQSGYSILTRSAEAGVDTFVKHHKKSLFVFFQGHPEYEAQSLLGEYRRDIGRFLRQENDVYPTMPRGYFNKQAEGTLISFQRKAVLDRRPELLNSFPADSLAKHLDNSWHSSARRIYRNWIQYLSTHRPRGLT